MYEYRDPITESGDECVHLEISSHQEDGTVRAKCRPGIQEWAKLVTGVDRAKSNGYALQGDWLDKRGQVDLPIGSIVVMCGQVGSRRRPARCYTIAHVSARGIHESKHRLDSVDLDFLDEIERLLAEYTPDSAEPEAAPEPTKTACETRILNEMAELLDHLRTVGLQGDSQQRRANALTHAITALLTIANDDERDAGVFDVIDELRRLRAETEAGAE